MTEPFDLIVIGAGPGGYVGAIRAAQLGLRTAIVERDKLGGTCLHWGCIPTKALLQTAHVLEDARHGASFGVRVDGVSLDIGAAHQFKSKVVSTAHRGVEFLMRKHKIAAFAGTATIAGPGRVTVALNDGSLTELQTRNVLIATGSRPRSVPGVTIDGDRVLSSDHIVNLQEVPARLGILGAGVIGVEFASVFSAFGSEVTMIEMLPRVLPLEDEDVSAAMQKALARRGVGIHTSARLTSVEPAGGGLRLAFEKDEQAHTIEVDRLLVSVGRAPVTEGLGLESVGIALDRGFVTVDERMRTNVPGFWAIGDVIPTIQLAHVASEEAVLAVETMAGHETRPIDYDLVPRCTYSIPEVASFGLTEAQAKEQGHAVKVGRFPFSANTKANILGVRDGFVKFVTDETAGEILGMHLIGPRVTEMLTEGILGKSIEATIYEIAHAMHAHPTLSEAIHEAALDALDRVVHI
jgi:dihydrolipoamide dehydrogenase